LADVRRAERKPVRPVLVLRVADAAVVRSSSRLAPATDRRQRLPIDCIVRRLDRVHVEYLVAALTDPRRWEPREYPAEPPDDLAHVALEGGRRMGFHQLRRTPQRVDVGCVRAGHYRAA